MNYEQLVEHIPSYLGNGHQAYAAGVVAAWPEHNRARFSVLLYTGQQLESAVAAERESNHAEFRVQNKCIADQHDEIARLRADATALRELLNNSQTAVCVANRMLVLDGLPGKIAEALSSTAYLKA